MGVRVKEEFRARGFIEFRPRVWRAAVDLALVPLTLPKHSNLVPFWFTSRGF